MTQTVVFLYIMRVFFSAIDTYWLVWDAFWDTWLSQVIGKQGGSTEEQIRGFELDLKLDVNFELEQYSAVTNEVSQVYKNTSTDKNAYAR